MHIGCYATNVHAHWLLVFNMLAYCVQFLFPPQCACTLGATSQCACRLGVVFHRRVFLRDCVSARMIFLGESFRTYVSLLVSWLHSLCFVVDLP